MVTNKRKQMNRKVQRGFTILEAMVALIILSLALLALLRVMPVGLKASKLGEDLTTATLLAQRKHEELRYNAWPPTGGSGDFGGAPYDNFEWERVVSGTATYLREVSISVFWPADVGSPGDRDKQRCVNIVTRTANYSSD